MNSTGTAMIPLSYDRRFADYERLADTQFKAILLTASMPTKIFESPVLLSDIFPFCTERSLIDFYGDLDPNVAEERDILLSRIALQLILVTPSEMGQNEAHRATASKVSWWKFWHRRSNSELRRQMRLHVLVSRSLQRNHPKRIVWFDEGPL